MSGTRGQRVSVGQSIPHSPDVRTVREGVRGKERLLVYELPEDALGAGSSLGNDKAWINSKATGALERLFSLDLGQVVAGSMVVRYSAPQHGLVPDAALPGQGPRQRGAYCHHEGRVHLNQARPGVFRIHPGYQERAFDLPGSIAVRETLFIPNTLEEDPAVVYQVITLRNESSSTRPLHVTAFANLRGATPEDVEGCFDKELGALLAWNTSQTGWVRVLGFSEPAADYMTTHDVSRADDPVSASELTRQVRAKGSLFGVVEVGVDLAPGEAKRLAVVLAFSPRGPAEARRIFIEARD
ncbi:MAG TPA: hypothetical protein VGN26_02055, partial [Armatimonadota bacterium]